jgi:AraC-like DNA-binding protein
VAALLDSRSALLALRRTVPRGTATVLPCRSPVAVTRAVQTRLLDAVVLGPKAARRLPLERFREAYPRIPVTLYGVVRSEDGPTLLEWEGRLGARVIVEGVDDPVAGEHVVRHSARARRRAELLDVPRLLRLTEPLQRNTWELLLALPGRPPSTGEIARRLKVSREHLSRQFGAGGAPNLKRVIDLLQVITALDLLGNPGYSLPAVSRLLGYSTPTHLRGVVRRITGLGFETFRQTRVGEILRRFVSGRNRSRV